jgi:bacterioferritin
MAKANRGEPKCVEALQGALDAEMTGVALYTHLSFRIFGPQWQAITALLRAQAAESLTHALAVGDRMTMLGAVPAVSIPGKLSHEPSTLDEVLRTSLVHERGAVEKYRAVLTAAAEAGDIPLEDWSRTMVSTETDHSSALERMLRPMG